MSLENEIREVFRKNLEFMENAVLQRDFQRVGRRLSTALDLAVAANLDEWSLIDAILRYCLSSLHSEKSNEEKYGQYISEEEWVGITTRLSALLKSMREAFAKNDGKQLLLSLVEFADATGKFIYQISEERRAQKAQAKLEKK